MKAFPGTPTFDQDANKTVWQEGMDLRDYFAAAVMQGFLANAYLAKKMKIQKVIFADLSYEMADAMLFRRNKKDGD